MRTPNDLRRILRRIDGRGYKAYKEIRGEYRFDDYRLSIDHVQGDPFAAPSRFRIVVEQQTSGFPSELIISKVRRVACSDFVARSFAQAIRKHCQQNRGSGRSGVIAVDSGGQEVLERSSVTIDLERTECRFVLGLPAAGRRVLGRQAEAMIFEEIPRLVRDALFFKNLGRARLEDHVRTVEDQQALRRQLEARGLVAFVANGAVLPRKSGIDDRPLRRGDGRVVIEFKSPPEFELELERPNKGPIRGMGIPSGVTLIVGGGYHGKSTLLRAIERSVYDHVVSDGRDISVTLPSAVKIRAEDGRYIESVDISPFITNLPYGEDTVRFSTENASGSTSQAANIIESLEVGAKLLLIDEDTSATNFIIRDARMQALVKKEKEPITPFVDKVQQLYREYGTSTILVMGGSGDYFDVADQVIMMDEYRPQCVTQKAKEVLEQFPTKRLHEGAESFGSLRNRRPDSASFDPRRGKREVKIEAKGLNTILFGVHKLDLSALEQLVDESQTRAIGEAILVLSRRFHGRGLFLAKALEELDLEMEEKGLDLLSSIKVGNLARPRIQEIAFAINRLRTLIVEQSS